MTFLFFCIFRRNSTGPPPTCDKDIKTILVREMADRVLSGEFTSAWEAPNVDKCVGLGVSYQSIQHHADKANPVEAAARVAERARVTHEKAEAEAKSNSVKMIFVEKGGAATGKKASSKAIKMFKRGESQKLHGIINLAGE